MNKDKAIQMYIIDLGGVLKEEALSAHSGMISADGDDVDWKKGEVSAFSDMIAWAQERAEHYGLSLEDVNLEDIDPDRDLAIPKKCHKGHLFEED